jgi:hypothetical protein
MRRPHQLLFAAVVLGLLALHAGYKLQQGRFGEMLWACHIASLLIGVGLLTRRSLLVAVGTVFHLALGLPAYVLDLIVSRQAAVTSVLVHFVPPLAGFLALRREAPWPRWTPIAAGSLYVALIPLSRWLTEPVLNVNVAFAPWPPLASLTPSLWVSWLVNIGAIAVVLLAFDRSLRLLRWMRRRSSPLGAGSG